MNNLPRVLAFFRGERIRIGFALLLMLGSAGLGLLKPWPMAVLADSVFGTRPFPEFLLKAGMTGSKQSQILMLALTMLVVHGLQALSSAGQNYLLIQAGLRGLAEVRMRVFDWLQRMSPRFHQGTRAGDIIYRACWDTFSFQTLFQHGLFGFISSFLSLALMVIVMWRVNRPLTLVALGTVPFLLLTIQSFSRRMSEKSAAAHEADSRVATRIQQAMTNLPLIQGFTREADEAARFRDQAAQALQTRSSQHGWEVAYLASIGCVFAAGTAAITWLGAGKVLQGEISLGELLVFLAYLGQLYEPLNQLSRVGSIVSDASAGTKRVFEILDTPEEIREKPDAKPVPASAAIEFRGVNFAYEGDRLVLRDLSLKIKAGETVAIIGPSGAGKSTLLQLVPRFYDPGSGSVLLGGVDLRDLKLAELRRSVTLIFQESLILPATVAENIAYGKAGAAREEVIAAAKSAYAHDFIERLPLGYDTIVGEGAARLSVGEKQRVNLARAFLKNSPIVLLDEPTSALDPESERLVLEGLRELARGRTVLMVAHRLNTIQQAGRVVVIGQGRVVQDGPPEGLKPTTDY